MPNTPQASGARPARRPNAQQQGSATAQKPVAPSQRRLQTATPTQNTDKAAAPPKKQEKGEEAAALARLTAIHGIGPRLAAELVARGLTTRRDLQKASVLASLPLETQLELKCPSQTVNWDLADSFVMLLRDKTGLGPALIPVGSLRRRVQHLNDIDLLTVRPLAGVMSRVREAAKPPAGNRILARGEDALFEIVGEYAAGPSKSSFVARYLGHCLRVDLFNTTREAMPFALLHHTGSKNFNVRCRAHAKAQGLKLNQFGLERTGSGPPIPALTTERAVLDFIGVTWLPPQSRSE